MCSAFWVIAGSALPPVSQEAQETLEIKAGSVLVYHSQAGEESHQFVIRLARFKPDIVLEWESLSHQGTLHFYRNAVEKARKVSIASLFEPGIDGEYKDQMTKWLSRQVYGELLAELPVKVRLNNIDAKLNLVGRDDFDLLLDKEKVTVRALRLEDTRRGVWLILDNPENPVLLSYESPYYLERLVRVSNANEMALRWIKRLPPVK